MAKQSILQALKSGRVLVSDGAWGTLLQEQGMQPGECPELWCVTHRTAVLGIARDYIAAGADMIESNSFGGTRCKLEHFGLAGRTAELNQAAAAISREAAGPDKWVIASVGPTGLMTAMGDVTEQDFYDFFKEQVVALAAGGADAICVETMSALDEAAAALRATRDSTTCEAICTFTFERTVRGEYRTMMGVSPADAARACVEAGAHVIGANCGNGMEHMIEIAREIRSAAPATPILVHSNAGLPKQISGVNVFPETPAEMADRVAALVAAGVNIIGGCCGTTPAHIAAIKQAVTALKR
ncbi:MAG: homocysteine S-methyltransferase family protein [bacterium]